MQTPIFFCQLLRKLSRLMAIGSTLHCLNRLIGFGIQVACHFSVTLLEKSDSYLHREIVTSVHIHKRDAGSCFNLL